MNANQIAETMYDKDFGISYLDIINNKENHNKIFLTQYEICYKYKNGKLYYAENDCWVGNGKIRQRFYWEKVYMKCYDLPYLRFREYNDNEAKRVYDVYKM